MSDKSNENAEPTILRVRDPQYREVYSNNVLVSMSAFDFNLTFSKNTEITPGQPGLVDQANVTMSPQQFKSLVRVLTDTLAAYEDNFGRLTIADSDIEPQLNKDDLSKFIAETRVKNLEARKKARLSLSR